MIFKGGFLRHHNMHFQMKSLLNLRVGLFLFAVLLFASNLQESESKITYKCCDTPLSLKGLLDYVCGKKNSDPSLNEKASEVIEYHNKKSDLMCFTKDYNDCFWWNYNVAEDGIGKCFYDTDTYCLDASIHRC